MINKACCSMLFIASIAIIIPTSALQFYGPERFSDTVLRNLSHAIAILLILLCAPALTMQQPTVPPSGIWGFGGFEDRLGTPENPRMEGTHREEVRRCMCSQMLPSHCGSTNLLKRRALHPCHQHALLSAALRVSKLSDDEVPM